MTDPLNVSHLTFAPFVVPAGERCPIEKCYYMSREYGLCLAFFEGTVPATYNYNMSSKVCEDNHGRLAILENKDKTMWVARMIEINTSKSLRIMKIVWVLLIALHTLPYLSLIHISEPTRRA